MLLVISADVFEVAGARPVSFIGAAVCVAKPTQQLRA
jgi:hypothetical protein